MEKCASKKRTTPEKYISPIKEDKNICISSASAEHARFDDPDLPCDDARGGTTKY